MSITNFNFFFFCFFFCFCPRRYAFFILRHYFDYFTHFYLRLEYVRNARTKDRNICEFFCCAVHLTSFCFVWMLAQSVTDWLVTGNSTSTNILHRIHRCGIFIQLVHMYFFFAPHLCLPLPPSSLSLSLSLLRFGWMQ